MLQWPVSPSFPPALLRSSWHGYCVSSRHATWWQDDRVWCHVSPPATAAMCSAARGLWWEGVRFSPVAVLFSLPGCRAVALALSWGCPSTPPAPGRLHPGAGAMQCPPLAACTWSPPGPCLSPCLRPRDMSLPCQPSWGLCACCPCWGCPSPRAGHTVPARGRDGLQSRRAWGCCARWGCSRASCLSSGSRPVLFFSVAWQNEDLKCGWWAAADFYLLPQSWLHCLHYFLTVYNRPVISYELPKFYSECSKVHNRIIIYGQSVL